MARAAGRPTASTSASAEPITRTCVVARVTAVYSVSRVPSGDPAAGSSTVIRANWLPWLRCTVIACSGRTAPSRTSGTRIGSPPRPNAATSPPAPSSTTTPVSPL